MGYSTQPSPTFTMMASRSYANASSKSGAKMTVCCLQVGMVGQSPLTGTGIGQKSALQ
uniref:Uncharacterized protein n=1 Tax=Arundo donax TaxID=35708 RepID=A0A0A8XSB8_ARUDO